MKASNENLLVKFRSKDTQFGVTRTTVKAIAKELNVNETQVIHMALSKFATDVLPAYAPDDGHRKILNGCRILIKSENYWRKLIKRCCALSLVQKKSIHLQQYEKS